MKHIKCHPQDCPACQQNGERYFCEDTGRISETVGRMLYGYCRRSAGRCGAPVTGPDGCCNRHAPLNYHHVGNKPNCQTCGVQGPRGQCAGGPKGQTERRNTGV